MIMRLEIFLQNGSQHQHPLIAPRIFVILWMFEKTMVVPRGFVFDVLRPTVERVEVLLNIQVFSTVQAFGTKQIHPRNIALVQLIWRQCQQLRQICGRDGKTCGNKLI